MGRLIKVWQIAAAYIGTIVGAGFASGQEIIQFFTSYGEWGALAAVISALLMAWIGTKMMIYSHRIRAYSFNELLEHLFGKTLGLAIECLLFLIVFGMTAVMLAGSGAVFREHLTGGRQTGMLLILAISVYFLCRGTRGLLSINALVVPVVILFFAMIAFKSGLHGFPIAIHSDWRNHWLGSSLRYASFNLLTALVVLVPLASDSEDEWVLRAGGWAGGIGLGLLLLVAHLLLLLHPEAQPYEMPMAELVRPLGMFMHGGFALVIFGEILTTFVGNVYGLSRQLHSAFPAQLNLSLALLLLIISTYCVAQIGYTMLLSTLYPIYGSLCALIFIYLIFVKLPAKPAIRH
ncbi:MAG: transporter [Sporolactobacillus sp.]